MKNIVYRLRGLRSGISRRRQDARRAASMMRPAAATAGASDATGGAAVSKGALAILLLAALMFIGWLLRRHGSLDPQILVDFVRGYPLSAPLIFSLGYAASVVLLIPTLPLNLGAGMLWGPWWGTLVAMVGSGLGALSAFAIARTTVGQPLARRFGRRALSWLQDKFDREGWKVVAFTRLNPVFPSGPLNFLFGMTAIRFSTYSWSSLLFLLPFTFVFALIGHRVGSLILDPEAERRLLNLAVLSGGVTLLAVGATVVRLLRDLRNGRSQ